jgi:hypothetical protein
MGITLKKNVLDIRGSINLIDAGPGRLPGRYVFQKTAPGLGNIPGFPAADRQMRRHVVPLDPMTASQIARRDLFRAAVARWRAPVGDDMQRWKIIAENRSIPVFNACLSDILSNYHLSGGLLVKN